MICDGVNDLLNALASSYYEKDETRKVSLIALLEGVEPSPIKETEILQHAGLPSECQISHFRGPRV